MTALSNKAIAAKLGVTQEQVARQRARNRKQVLSMAERAKATGKKVNGYTADQLFALAERAL